MSATANARAGRATARKNRRRVARGELKKRPPLDPSAKWSVYLCNLQGYTTELVHSAETRAEAQTFVNEWLRDDLGLKPVIIPPERLTRNVVDPPALLYYTRRLSDGAVKVVSVADPRMAIVNQLNQEMGLGLLRAGLVEPESITLYEVLDGDGTIVERETTLDGAIMLVQGGHNGAVKYREVRCAVVSREGGAA